MKLFIASVLAAWFVLIFVLGASQAFVRTAESPPLPIVIGAVVPLAAFIAAYLGSGSFQQRILTADLRLLTAIQAWRAGGLVFLALHTYGLLPGLFAWPAGLGDIAIGVTAPWVALALMRRPAFAGSRAFAAWNILGILDLIVAVGTGALSSGFVPGLVGQVTTAPMARLPLVLIPAYLVPLFIMLHLTALFQARRVSLAREPEQHDRTASAQRLPPHSDSGHPRSLAR